MKSTTDSIWTIKAYQNMLSCHLIIPIFKKISKPPCPCPRYWLLLRALRWLKCITHFSYCSSTGCWYVRVLYGRAFININIAEQHKPMTSQFDDWLIIGWAKRWSVFKNLNFTTLILMDKRQIVVEPSVVLYFSHLCLNQAAWVYNHYTLVTVRSLG